CFSVRTPSRNLDMSSTKDWSFLSSTTSGTKLIVALQFNNPEATPTMRLTSRVERSAAPRRGAANDHHLRPLIFISRPTSSGRRENQTTTQGAGCSTFRMAREVAEANTHPERSPQFRSKTYSPERNSDPLRPNSRGTWAPQTPR